MSDTAIGHSLINLSLNWSIFLENIKLNHVYTLSDSGKGCCYEDMLACYVINITPVMVLRAP